MSRDERPTDARRALLERLIDHAPLFPPASLPLEEALAEDRRVRAGETAWMVNRFVCPASKLQQLGDEPLRLSVVIDREFAPPEDARIEAVESPPHVDPEVLVDLAPEIYCEIRLDDYTSFRIDQLVELGLRVKVRCGGDTVPRVSALAELIRLCRERSVPFKATAGLHHPVRTNGEHGFLNLLAAAVFGDEEAALAEDDASAFDAAADGFCWRDRSAPAEAIARVRRRLFVGFGSCSAQEPIDGLRELGILSA